MKPGTSQVVQDLLFVAGAYVCPVCDRVTRSDWCPGCALPLSPAALGLAKDEDAIVRAELARMGIQVTR